MHETVKDMIDQEVVSVRQSATVAEAALKMLEHGVRHLPVVGEDREMLGIVDSEDLLHVTRDDIASAVKPAPLMLDGETSSFEAVGKLEKAGSTYAAIVDSGKLIGLVTWQDVLRFFKNS